MKIQTLAILFCAIAISAIQAFAGTFELNTTRGVWQLNASLSPMHTASSQPLSANFAIGALPGARYFTESGNQFLSVNSATAPNGGLKPNEIMTAPVGSGGNGPAGALYANEWSVVMDIRFPTIGSGYVAILQDDVQNTTDGEIFINAAREIQFFGATGPGGADPVVSPALAANTWYRLAFTSTYSAALNKQVLKVYINGTVTSLTNPGNITATPDGRFALGNDIAIFSDENNETGIAHLGSLATWRRGLSAFDISAIGTYAAAGLTWTNITPAGGTPPLPPLTGRILFGDFVGLYTPPTGQALLDLASSAVSSTYPGAVCGVTLALGNTGGRVNGFPNHSFGGDIPVAVLANGDVVALDSAALSFNGGGQDVGSFANVTFVRQNMLLDKVTGLNARFFKIYFPPGMSVAMAEDDMRAFDRANMGSVDLNQSLAPKSSLTLQKSNFETYEEDSGPVWVSTERIPIRFPANAISYSPNNGLFTFTPAGSNTPHRNRQKLIMRDLIALGAGVKGAVAPSSNDFYFLGGFSVASPVLLGARSGGISFPQSVELVLSTPPAGVTPGETTTHFPKLQVKWTGTGSLLYGQGSIDEYNSNLPSNLDSTATYARGVVTGDCKGEAAGVAPAAGSIFVQPIGSNWTFTADGGLKSPCGLLENSSTAFVPKWGGYKDGGTDLFAHQFTGQITSCWTVVAGNAVVGSEVATTPIGQRPAAMLLSGHGFPGNDGAVERPGSGDYQNFGLTDYPGFNLRPEFGSYNARSRLAGSLTAAYPLSPSSKYYIRQSGVSGLHLTPSTTPITLSAYGSDFALSALNLAFLDGRNVASGVGGNVVVKTPNSTSFALNFEKLIFGPQGQLQEAKLAASQGVKMLGYWNLQITPNAIDFPQPKTCPPPGPGTGFVRVGVTATLPALTSGPVTGTLGFYNSDLVTESSPVGAGYPKISRFEPGGLLSVPGPNGTTWNVNCTSGVYLNQQASSGNDAGTLNAGGVMDLPFFTDMPVHLRTPSAGSTGAPLVYVRNAIIASGSYDPNHTGREAGASVAEFLTGATYNPTAFRKWQDLISFSVPVAMAPGTATFRSQAPASGDVFLFKLSEGIPKMTPDQAELIFDGKANVGVDGFLKQINFGTLLTGTTLGNGVQTQINSALSSITGLDDVLADNIQDLVKPALSASAGQRGNATFFTGLKNAANRSSFLDTLAADLTTDTRSIFSSGTSGVTGQSRRELEARISQVESGLTTARGLVDTATKLSDLAKAIATATSNSPAPAAPDTERLAELQGIFNRATFDLANARLAIGAPLNSAMTPAGAGISEAITAALNDLRQKWAPTDPSKAAALYNNATAADFSGDLAKALTDRLGGSAFAGVAQQITRQYLADVRVLARQALDDTIATATSLLPSPASVAGDYLESRGLSGQLAAAKLKGYARFQGDTLDELRLDGSAALRVPDEMKFDAYFLFKNVDSSTPGGACLLDAGVEAEISMGASAKLDWPGQGPLDIAIGGKVGLNGSGTPIGLCGDIKLIGQLDFSEVRLKEISLGFGFGGGNYYLYGKGAGKVAAMDIAAGVFIGRSCELTPILNADPDIGKVVASQNLTPPYTGASIYAFGGISLMPIIGIPPSCLLDVRVGGGQGFFAFDTPGAFIAGFKTTQSISGEILCIASVTGRQDSVLAGTGALIGGSPKLLSVVGTSRFTVNGKIGIGWLSYDFEKSVGLLIKASPITWKIDY